MNRLIKVLSFSLVLTLAITSCGEKHSHASDGEKKACCADKEAQASVDGEAKSCDEDCEKACCADKKEGIESSEEMQEEDHDHEH